ncbi:hypothetical protein CBW46_018335 [Paenibacillus xerothermodurans]|uniref:Uncharacterized protein n=1 Tax=Paenibacillus xerothermodurans TaxID=1977292 RepID=A0A2W1NP21_PAEXE|nr:hypothetical protein CBW46_018335 [Paenibacillus xerothermodurans]
MRENTNSVGNLCMHLGSNEYQNIISAIGGRPFIRERSLEFQVNAGMTGAELIVYLHNIRSKCANFKRVGTG